MPSVSESVRFRNDLTTSFVAILLIKSAIIYLYPASQRLLDFGIVFMEERTYNNTVYALDINTNNGGLLFIVLPIVNMYLESQKRL